ncbi:hypothetical protein [Maribacter sp. R86514]|uniref:hypothetical protein n=1 Tax=Maribacter sp. R86514 TaxID=3093854 RepID=UPI0037C5A82A
MSELSAMLRAENAADKFLETFKNKKNYENLNNLNLEELKELNKMVLGMMEEKGKNLKNQISIGDLVTVNSKKSNNDVFEVVKLNPKKAVIKDDKGTRYNCPYELLNLI